MVLVLLNGSAVAINWENENIPAIIEAWYPGQAGGTAIADVIFGDYNPGGRLPLTFYKDINDIPAFSDYNMKGKTYRYFKGDPLYEFGFGLSFTTFNYSNLKVPNSNETNKDLIVSVDVTNTGTIDGDEVVQLYSTKLIDDGLNPTRSLIGFKRIFLKTGETKTVDFKVSPKQLAIVDENYKHVVNNETLLISAGGAQPNEQLEAAQKVITKEVQLTGETYSVNN
jgi:beta-glucosidase